MSFAVQPDTLAVAAALSGHDAGGVDKALHLVVTAGQLAAGGVAPGSEALRAAIHAYVHVEATAATALADATRLLATGLADAGSRYARAESAVLTGFAGGGP